MTGPMRLPPMKDEELDATQEEVIAPFRKMGVDFNVSRAMIRHPRALAAFRVWATYVMIDKNALPEREREIVAMRTAFKILAPYVWSRHISYGQRAGLTEAEMAALKRPIDAHPWSEAERALILMTDELVKDFYASDAVWAQLSAHYTDEQCMDAVFCCGHFCLLGMFLNTAGTPLDADVPYDPDLDRFA